MRRWAASRSSTASLGRTTYQVMRRSSDSGNTSWADRLGEPGLTSALRIEAGPPFLGPALGLGGAAALLVRNPCMIKGAGQKKVPERPIASIPQVFDIAETIEPRFRAMVLVSAFVGLRLGEMLAMTRERVDLLHGRIKVVERYQELKDGTVSSARRSPMPVCARWLSRRCSSPSWRLTSPSSLLRARRASCSAGPMANRCAGRADTPRGVER